MPNIVLIGAGSASFSVELIRDIVNTDGLAGSTLALVDIDPQRLQVAHTLAIRLCEETGGQLELVAVTNRRQALVGADFVISAVKVGGYGPLEEDRKIAEQAGYYRGIGDRVSCYYGGIGAYHQFRFLMGLARDMEELCPEAWLIQTANPVLTARISSPGKPISRRLAYVTVTSRFVMLPTHWDWTSRTPTPRWPDSTTTFF